MPQQILLYSWQVSNKQSDVDRDEQVDRCAKVHVRAVDAIEALKLRDVREDPERYHSMQSF